MAPHESELRALLDDPDLIVPQFQPVFDIETGDLVGYEALARWTRFGDVGPFEMFATARELRVANDFDWLCRRAAIREARDTGLRKPLTLFVNVEPRGLRASAPFRVDAAGIAGVLDQINVVVELTERDLFHDPAAVVAAVEWARCNGVGVALDDVGANPESLTMLQVLRPDIVKLDGQVVRHPLDHPNTLRTVADYVEQTGAVILAEGIETTEHLRNSAALGARYGQGYLLGRPAPLPATPEHSVAELPKLDPVARAFPRLPSEILSRTTNVISPKSIVSDICFELGRSTAITSPPECVLVAMQPGPHHDEVVAGLEAVLNDHSLIGFVGAGLRPDSPLRGSDAVGFDGEVCTTILGIGYSAAVVGRRVDQSGPLLDRRYEWTITHDRDIVSALARCLMSRLAPLPDDNDGRCDSIDG